MFLEHSGYSMRMLVALLACTTAQLYSTLAAPVVGSSPMLRVVRIKNSTAATLATVGNPQPFFHAYFTAASSGPSDCAREWTTRQARHHKCLFATNGGPFSFKDLNGTHCIGPLVSDGRTVVAGGGNVFGLTTSGQFVLGKLGADYGGLSFRQLIGAFGMLVVNGTALGSADPKVAPRTAIGVDAQGRLLIFEADGAEKFNDGLTTAELALWLRDLGAVWAINLDGGGSSTVAYPQGELWNRPTCIDLPWPPCERSVTTITCITE